MGLGLSGPQAVGCWLGAVQQRSHVGCCDQQLRWRWWNSLTPPRCLCLCSLSVVALRFSRAGRWDSAGRFCSRSASCSHAQSALPGRPQAVVSQNAPHCHDRLGFWQSRALKLQHLCAQAVLPVRRAGSARRDTQQCCAAGWEQTAALLLGNSALKKL